MPFVSKLPNYKTFSTKYYLFDILYTLSQGGACMEYEIEKWPIHKLIAIFDKGQIALNPPYQRNPIWSLKAQRKLINSIKTNKPIPNFFLLAKGKKKFEMVDGQQRARTIIGYWKGHFADTNKNIFDDVFRDDPSNEKEIRQYLDYDLNVTIITKIQKNESIEEFYALVNSSGLRLNRPELKKAEYYSTNFLHLINNLAENPDFQALQIFSRASINRMNNIDFVSELIALINYGISEKKEKVDELFEKDINEKKYKSLQKEFIKIIRHFKRFNLIFPLVKTRYSQKNDFYSLFYFMLKYQELQENHLDYYYKLLLKLARYTKPSQEECDPLMNYALNCVTQSNSKHARRRRHEFLVELLLNEDKKPNKTQVDIINFLNMKKTDIKQISIYTTLNIKAIRDPKQEEMFC